MRIYTYKNQEFRLKANNLNLRKQSADFMLKYEDYMYNATKNIDFYPLQKYRNKMSDFNTAISQLSKKNLGSNNDIPDENKNEIKKLNKSLTKLMDDFENDQKAQSLLQYEKKIENLVFLKLISDENVIKPLIDDILIGNTKIIDYDNEDTLIFLSDILRDFFLTIGKNKI
ncbi:MAG: hypothetical protein FJ216_07395 [Ignavibacteria bacterium]|nr:hypothetical protein [Ignavibacteria bacterium]